MHMVVVSSTFHELRSVGTVHFKERGVTELIVELKEKGVNIGEVHL